MDEFLAAMVANSSYSKTKDAVRRAGRVKTGVFLHATHVCLAPARQYGCGPQCTAAVTCT